jgi:tetratricopeptide (TPR) repeat protein
MSARSIAAALCSRVCVPALALGAVSGIGHLEANAQKPVDHADTSTGADWLHGIGTREGAQAEGMPDLNADCPNVDEFGGSRYERAAYCRLNSMGPKGERHFVDVRELANRALREDPQSFRAHLLMGIAQHQGEGNLPKAIHHLERAEQLFIEQYGDHPSVMATPWKVFNRTMLELVYVHGEMDHHKEKIKYVDLLRERLNVDFSPLKAWPLLKLKRFDEARVLALEAATREDDPWLRAVGLTALCAIESEMRNRQAAYDACKAAAAPVMADSFEGAIELSNAAAAASEMFRFDEAERYYTEATRRVIEGSVNPWGRLTRLYLRQGRFSEALSAWRRMTDYRKSRPAYLDQQDQSDADLIGVSVLMIAGRTKDALPITERTVNRPDRQGTSSAQSEQNEAGAAIMDRVIKLDYARQLEEEASVAPFFDSLKLRAHALKLRAEAWVVGRRAAEVLADRERLVTSLRPECPGSIELPEWLDAEVIHVVGPGVALAAIEEGRQEETLPPELAELIFRALEAEAELESGDDARAWDHASWVVQALPATEALLRARAAAVAARAAWNLKQVDHAMDMYGVVMATDPGAIRRLGLTLPVVLLAGNDTPEVAKAIDLLKGSPLFEEERWGFQLRVFGDGAVLALQDGTEVLRVHIAGGKAKDVDDGARRIARAVHRELLIPNVDITQADIRSLDGSLGSGGRASERAKSVLDEVMEQSK